MKDKAAKQMRLLQLLKRRGANQPSNVDSDQEFEILKSKIESLELENSRIKALSRELVATEGQQLVEQVFTEISQPLVYIATQVSIIDSGSEVASGDLAATARMTLDAVRRLGGEFLGRPMSIALYDPELHDCLQTELQRGTPVEIKIPGLMAPSGRVVRKAVVEAQ